MNDPDTNAPAASGFFVSRNEHAGGSTADSTRAHGRAAEKAAAKWLRSQGCRIAAMNFYTPRGEIDIIATEGDNLLLCEVKMRSGRHIQRYGRPGRAVDRKKRRHITLAAAEYIRLYRPEYRPLVYVVEAVRTELPDGWVAFEFSRHRHSAADESGGGFGPYTETDTAETDADAFYSR